MTDTDGGGSLPSSALVCGSAFGLDRDLAEARWLRPSAHIIAVNNACRFVQADHLFTLHPEKMRDWRSLHTGKWGTRPPTHSGRKRGGDFDIDFWWPEASGMGSSGWAAARFALAYGYSEVILCGVPLDPVPYHRRGPAKSFGKASILETYRTHVLQDSHEGIISMSGWTRELLGGPVG